MGEAIGAILPLALGIAISPIPVIAAILMLLSPRAKWTSLAFLAGWVVGIVAALVVFELLASIIPAGDPDASRPIAAVVKILLGLGLLFLAVRQWRGRPKRDAEPAMPKWMSAADQLTPARGFGLGFLLSAVNPKNLLLAAGAGVEIRTSGLEVGETVIVSAIFVVLAAISVAAPVVAYLFASSRLAGPLDSLRDWLVHNNATIMAVLLLVIGVVVIGKGIGSF